MHVCTVSGVDYRHGRYLAGVLGSPLDVVAHHYHVGVVGHHKYRVFQRLAFGHARGFGVGETNDFGTQSVGRCLEAESCARGRLKKQCCNDFTLEQLSVGMFLKFLRQLYHIHDFVFRQVGNCYKIVFHSVCVGIVF